MPDGRTAGAGSTSAPAADPPIRVFLLDDHELIRRGLHDLLAAEPDITVVGEAGLAADAIRDLAALRPDVAILDLRLPDGNGVDVCRQVRAANPGVACVILTSFDDPHALLAAIAAGAAGFVLKDIRNSGLLRCVRQAAAGQSLLDPILSAAVLDRLHEDEAPVGTPGRERLSPDELAVLRLVAAGLTDHQIGERLYLPERSVKIHLTRVLVKLGLPTYAGPPHPGPR